MNPDPRLRKTRSKPRQRVHLKIWKRQNGRCKNCGDQVAIVREIQKQFTITAKPKSYVCWLDNKGNTRRRKVSTIDHITPRWAGGTNKQENLQVLCYQCNHEKAIEETDQFRKHKRGICRKCGAKCTPMKRKCDRCRNRGNNTSRQWNVIIELLDHRGEMNGLEMIKARPAVLKRGTIYITLNRMEEHGVISSRYVEGERRSYRLTDGTKEPFSPPKGWPLTGTT